jgi:hypothetical protein
MKCRVYYLYVILLAMSNVVCTQVQYLVHFSSQIMKSRSLHSLVYMVTSLRGWKRRILVGFRCRASSLRPDRFCEPFRLPKNEYSFTPSEL